MVSSLGSCAYMPATLISGKWGVAVSVVGSGVTRLKRKKVEKRRREAAGIWGRRYVHRGVRRCLVYCWCCLRFF